MLPSKSSLTRGTKLPSTSRSSSRRLLLAVPAHRSPLAAPDAASSSLRSPPPRRRRLLLPHLPPTQTLPPPSPPTQTPSPPPRILPHLHPPPSPPAAHSPITNQESGHVTEEHVIEEDEEDEIDSQDDIDDNENMEEGDDEPLFDISRVNNTEIEYEQDPPDVFTSDQWRDEAMMNNSHEGIDVPCTLEGEEPHVQWIRLDWALITALAERWRSETQTFHLRHGEMSITLQDVAILMGLPIDGDAVVGDTSLDWTDVCMALLGDLPDMMRRGSVKLFWLRESDKTGNSVPLMYLPLLEDFDRASRYSWGGATLAYLYRQLSIACKSDANDICGSLTLLQLWSWERLHVGRPDIAMHPLAQDMPLGHRWNVPRAEINNPRHVLRLYRSELDHKEDYQVQRTNSSTSDAGPSEPCAGTPQQPDDVGPPQFSPNVMKVSQYGLYDIGASQILTDEGMPNTQPPQSTVGDIAAELWNWIAPLLSNKINLSQLVTANIAVRENIMVRWIPPKINLSLNMDGACKGNPGVYGGGVYFRNQNGDFICGFAFAYGWGKSIIAEARAIHDGLRLALEKHLHVAIVYSDSAILVRAIIDGKLPHWAVFPWWRGICHMLQIINPKIVHTFREGSQVADALASLA
ncbi:hypothetical protein Taro_024575 [Colocasia esculenta]|uniref:Aminotransferase-like plant mobile domain-containing protein n=1 Tax=Colocasia esculenta TaxID=4460 RepID=A0A843VE24_COLES|nr:hypothetical protein [Colocasia esculenta]